MGRKRTDTVLITRVDGEDHRRQPDELIVEEPMEIRLDEVVVATTMRTPGHDYELAVGFCFNEGLLGGHSVTGVRYCATGSAVDSMFNIVTVSTAGRAPVPTPRLGTTSSSCGLCGSTTISELTDRLGPLDSALTHRFELSLLADIPNRMVDGQGLFAATGAVHAAVAFDATGTPVVAREDVGRHNAVDKVVGSLLLAGQLPAHDLGLYVSGRASFEMVQKAWAAGFGTVVAVSAPTSLAVDIARRAGITLVGFVRGSRINVYAPERLTDR